MLSKPAAPLSLAIAERISHRGPMLLVLKVILWGVRSLALSRQALVLDNLHLRQQLAVAVHSGRRPQLVTVDRAFWVAMRAVWTDWQTSLAIVKPATVVAWHRRAYRASYDVTIPELLDDQPFSYS